MLRMHSFIKTIFIVTAIFALVHIVNAATVYSGNTSEGENNKNISLKNLGKYKTNFNVPSLKLSQFQYKGSNNFLQTKSSGNILQIKSTIKLQKGNTTYLYPYKYNLKLQSIFKSPVQPIH